MPRHVPGGAVGGAEAVEAARGALCRGECCKSCSEALSAVLCGRSFALSLFFFPAAVPSVPIQPQEPTALQLAVMEAAASPLCPGAVRAAIAMPTNAHHFDIAMLQRNVMQQLGLSCALARLVTVCLDSPCLALCERRNVPRCIALGTELKGGDFGDEHWLRIAAAKWQLMSEAVSTGVNTLLLDDDVLVLGDVFAAMGGQAGGSSAAELDVQYSAKYLEAAANCGADANAGVVFVRATAQGRRFLDAMVSFKPRIEGAAKMTLEKSHLLLDQELFPEAIALAGARRCILPPAQFVGHCHHSRNATLRLGGLVTFHATCTETAARKLAVMQRVADAALRPGGSEVALMSVDPDGAPLARLAAGAACVCGAARTVLLPLSNDASALCASDMNE